MGRDSVGFGPSLRSIVVRERGAVGSYEGPSRDLLGHGMTWAYQKGHLVPPWRAKTSRHVRKGLNAPFLRPTEPSEPTLIRSK